jgi:hypothetical protein
LFVFMLATFFFFFWSCVLKKQKAWRVQSNWFWSWLYLSSEKMRFLTSPRYGFCSVLLCVCVCVCAFSFFPHSLSSFVHRIFISAKNMFWEQEVGAHKNEREIVALNCLQGFTSQRKRLCYLIVVKIWRSFVVVSWYLVAACGEAISNFLLVNLLK